MVQKYSQKSVECDAVRAHGDIRRVVRPAAFGFRTAGFNGDGVGVQWRQAHVIGLGTQFSIPDRL